MLVIPAIDLRQGKCVRLVHGDEKNETIYSDDPVRMARHWVAQGAQRIHVIDLDGITIDNEANTVQVQFRPTIPHCSM